MIVRRAAADEVPILQEIERDAAQSYGLLQATAFCVALPVRDVAEHAGARATGTTLVAEDDGGLFDFLLAVPVDGRAHCLELAVRRSHQRRGSGRRLVTTFEGWAREAGFAATTLTTFRDVPWNAPFYARLGYRVLEVAATGPGLRRLIAEETAAGFDIAPRVAMMRVL